MKNKSVMRRKYQVFISSTKKDLENERKQVAEAIAKLGCIPAGMENFPAGEKSWTLIKKDIDDSDIYVLITAGCYGSTTKVRNKIVSYTEKEYDYAKKTGKTILAFVIKDINKLTLEQIDKKKDVMAFHKKVMGCGDNVAFWTDTASLVSEVKSSLGQAIKSKTSGGWIKLNEDISDTQAEVLTEWGLQRIFKTRAEKNNESDPLLESYDIKQLDGIAFGLRSFRSIRKKDVINNLNSGMHMRLLVMDPDSVYAKFRAREENEPEDSISNSIRDLISWVAEVKNESTSGAIEVKVYNAMTLDFYWRIDDVMYVGPYLYGVPSQQTITVKFKKPGRGFELYESYFEDLWNNSSLCYEPK